MICCHNTLYTKRTKSGYGITLERNDVLADNDLKRSKHVGVVLSVLSESYIGAFVG